MRSISGGWASSSVIELHTLGALELRDAEAQALHAILAQPKRVALLVYLTLATPRGFHRRDTLIALFWPEHDTDHARNSLNQSVHALRRALGVDTIVSRNGDALSVDPKHVWCDAVAFEEALEAGRRSEAVELYRGDLLAGFHVANAPEFERWLETERERLARLHQAALEELAKEREAARDFTGASQLWRKLAACDPYSSRVALGLMRALAAAGDPAGAVQHARVHETLVRQDLDVAPDAEVAALVRRLQSGGRAAVSLSIGNEPIAPAVRTSERGPLTTVERRRDRRRTTMMAAGVAALFAAGAGAVALKGGAREPEIPPIRSLAVLPLENLSGDSAQQPFTDGMHDALITELARYPDLSVISRTSVMPYKGKGKPLPEIARELKVDGIIEGTLLWEAGRVRVNAQLIHASDRHVWAKSYSRDLREVLALQAELAEAIAREVRVASSPPKRPPPRITGPADSLPKEMYLKELYLRGRHAEISRSATGLQVAKEAYRRAIEQDSTFALGYAGLSGIYYLLADYDYAPARPALDSARIIARRAVALDSALSETRTALAVMLASDRQYEAAESEFLTAIRLAPSNARAHFWYSVLLVALGRGEEGLREANRAAELDPFAPRGVTAMQRYARWLITGERADMKVPVAERRLPILKIEPGEPLALASEALDLAEQGNCTEARSVIQRAQQFATENSMRMLQFVGAVYWWCGDRARSRALNDRMKRLPAARDQGARIAMMHVLFGEKDSAFLWIRRTQWTLGQLSGLSADRRWDSLRADPRYAEFLRELGLRNR
jgi:DNA-binding SARP family transcriptional activator/TolB-like protein/Tfp pilus assembly protein PilF